MSDEPRKFQDLGGFGEEPLRRSDLQLLQQALRGDWPIAPQTRHWILRELGNLVETSKSRRTQLMALRTLMAASGLNIRQQAVDLAREKFEYERGGNDTPTAADAVREMMAAAQRYEREHPDAGDRGGTGEVPEGPGAVQ
jgi:hypothetical protein